MSVRPGRPKAPREIWLLVRVSVVLTVIRLLLRRVKLPTLIRLLSALRLPPGTDLRTVENVASYADALLWRLPFSARGNCVPRSLTLYYFATRCGFPVQVHFGVNRMSGTLHGHAWLSLDGKPFLEEGNPADCYTVTFSFPAGEHAPRSMVRQ